MPWSLHVHTGITGGPRGQAHTGPLVLGPPWVPNFTCICSEAVGPPAHGWSPVFAFLQKRSLLSRHTLQTQAAHDFAHFSLFVMIPPPSAGLASLQVSLVPCSLLPAPNQPLFKIIFFTLPEGAEGSCSNPQPQFCCCPFLFSALSLNFPLFITCPPLVPQPIQQVESFSHGWGHGL